MKQQVFSLVTFIIILSWPIAGQAQAQFARNAAKVSKSLKHPAVAGAVCVSLQNQQRQMDEIRRQTLNSSRISKLQMTTPQVYTTITRPSKVMKLDLTKRPVTMPKMPSLKLDTIPDHTPLYSAETQEKSRVDALALDHVSNGDADADAY